MRFTIGDRVIGCGIMSNFDITGLTGTIVCNKSSLYDYAVDFDEPVIDVPGESGGTISFHNCSGMAKDHCGYFCMENVLDFLDEPETWSAESINLSELLS